MLLTQVPTWNGGKAVSTIPTSLAHYTADVSSWQHNMGPVSAKEDIVKVLFFPS